MRQAKGSRMRFVTSSASKQKAGPPAEQSNIIRIDPGPGANTVCCRRSGHTDGGLHKTNAVQPNMPQTGASAPVTFDNLHFSERFIIWAARFWWTLNRQDQGILTPLGDAFRIAKAPSALGPFDAVMTVIAMKSKATPEFGEARSVWLTRDEKRLLFLTASKPGRMRDIVSAHMLRCQGSVLLRPLLSQLAEELDCAGLRPPRRLWDFPEVTASTELFPTVDL